MDKDVLWVGSMTANWLPVPEFGPHIHCTASTILLKKKIKPVFRHQDIWFFSLHLSLGSSFPLKFGSSYNTGITFSHGSS
jgi:hypothetical protein